MNIVGEGLPVRIGNQIRKRQEIYGSLNRTPEQLLYLNSRTSFVKAISSVDIETNLRHDTIWCCCTYNLDTKEVMVWTESQSFQEFIKKATLIVGHNGISFDFPVLNRVWKTTIQMNQVRDTLVMSRLSNPTNQRPNARPS